ncbi:MAG: ribonuclease HI [Clostridia bacterium]|nr:ribonuclease HI [Clostridia bacterium]
MKEVSIYTDGACRGNPGRGGWGAILVYGQFEKELSGGERETTNNRMELLAAIEGLRALKEPCRVTLYSDSKYLVDAFNLGWTKTWQEEHFRTGKKNEVKNPDLWQTLLDLVRIHEVTFVWVRGHNGHAYNERCDTLATTFADSFLQEEEDASQRPE